jgi:hypothetical protein
MMQFTTLKELVEAIKGGSLVLGENDALTIDNDDTYLYTYKGRGECGLREYAQIFSMDTQELLEQALDLLGIPHKPA